MEDLLACSSDHSTYCERAKAANLGFQNNTSGVASDKDCLHRLDNDTLLQIFDKLRPQGYLRSLSVTCKWVRTSCAPTLFSECSVKSKELSSGRSHFLPESLWYYVRTLRLNEYFLRLNASRDWVTGLWGFPPAESREDIKMEKEALALESRAGSFLEEALKHLPSLHTVIVDNESMMATTGPDKAGIPLPVILAILSVPQVQCFKVSGYLYHPVDPSPARRRLALSNLTSFIYDIPIFRMQPRTFSSEGALLNLIIPALRLSLEKLVLPVENAPLQKMYMEEWPSLRVLTLYGQRRTVVKPCIPYITILARMPKLQSLNLFFANPWNIDPQAIWPQGFSMSFPWPELQQLTVTQPHAGDVLWAHLPESLRTLSLRCWPRHWEQEALRRPYRYLSPLHQAEVHWHTPLLSSSDMLHILQQCQTPFLDHLDIEYQIDNQEAALLQHISSVFPLLKVLKISRYQHPAIMMLPLTDIVNALVPLKAICTLYLYADELPSYFCVGKQEVASCNDLLVQDLTRNMSKTLEVIYVSFGHHLQRDWREFKIIRALCNNTKSDIMFTVEHCADSVLGLLSVL
ncbi:hypothetical protein CPB84DRAFT_1728433 [Gymnopilus junonius]|uniref:F-box domain-containing protein n=1 Tax=Gymnopilus junonius TaxID=109634 RepID=A0A9P5NNM6_GYMJU|nr:hypothetical protein CPB84DRAFT_1728433 [Gymnopilus junonius]